jgi:hypothetical protein
MSENAVHENRNPARRSPAPPHGWDDFERDLAGALGVLKDEVLVVASARGNRYVQFMAQPGAGLRAESVSNAYLEPDERLDDGQLAALAALGWSPPTGTPEEAAPPKQPRGSPNHFREFPNPVPFDAVAHLAVRTLVEVLRIPEPRLLEYRAFDRAGHTVLFPALGLPRASPPIARPSRTTAPALPRLRARLLAAARSVTGDGTLGFDQDGDIPVPLGRRIAYVKACDKPLVVRAYCQLAPRAEGDEKLVRRLHEINARLALVRLVHVNGSVFAAVDFLAAPFSTAHLAASLTVLQRVADEVSRELRGTAESPAAPDGTGAGSPRN